MLTLVLRNTEEIYLFCRCWLKYYPKGSERKRSIFKYSKIKKEFFNNFPFVTSQLYDFIPPFKAITPEEKRASFLSRKFIWCFAIDCML
jgi:hypothetical protein